MRILITGSRTWTDPKPIRAALGDLLGSNYDPPFIVVQGGAQGADYIAARWAEDEIAWSNWPVTVEHHPADWKTHGRRAGILRNIEMVEAGADLCLAFIRDESRGATHCARIAAEHGIETRILRWEDRPVEVSHA